MSEETTSRGLSDRVIIKRLRLVRTIAVGILLIFTGFMVNLQVNIDPKSYEAYSTSDEKKEVVPATRGPIVDRNGVVLAVEVAARNVIADPKLVSDPAGEAERLAAILDVDATELATDLAGSGRYKVLARNVTPAVWQRISELGLPGIYSEASIDRSYPEGTLAANLLGFVNSAGDGSGGIELAYENQLAGIDGYRMVVGGTSAGDSSLPVAGDTVHLTIDRDIQWVAQQAIAKRVKESKAESGSIVVYNAKTGEILAMATAPTFDPNDLASARSTDLGNRVLTDTYEPGSVGKIMTIAAVLEERKLNPDSKLTVPNRLKIADKKFRDHEDHPTLRLTLTGVLAKSSNIGTIMAAQTIGEEKLYRYFRKFGIGKSTGLDFPGEENGSLPELKDWSGTTFPTLAFGQGYSVNTLQTAMVFGTVANGGIKVQPKLVAGLTDVNGVYRSTSAAPGVRVVSKETANTVVRMMESVTGEGGTAQTARIRGYRVAGKTGTAQLIDPACACYRGYLASFVGLAPADNPELVVAVSLVRPTGFSHYGGVLAGPVFRQVMSFSLQQLRLPPSGEAPPKLKLEW